MGFVPGLSTEIEAFLTEKGSQEIMTNGIGSIKYFAVSDDASNYISPDKLTYNQVFTLGGKLAVDGKFLSVVNDTELRSRVFVENSLETFKSFEGGSGAVIIENDTDNGVTNNYYSVYFYDIDKSVATYNLNWLNDLRIPYGVGDTLLWNTSFNSGGFSDTSISDMSNNNCLLLVIDGSQHAYIDGKSIKLTLPYLGTTVDLYGSYLNTNMNKNFYDGLNSDTSQFIRRFGPNATLLFCDNVSRPNGGDPSKSWATGYNYSNAPFSQGNKSLANFITNGGQNKDTAVGIAFLDKGVIVIFNTALYNGFIGRSNNNLTLNNRNLIRRTVVNFVCDLPIGQFYRSQNTTFSSNLPIRISSIGLFNESKELMAIGRFNSEVEKKVAQRLTFLVKLVI